MALLFFQKTIFTPLYGLNLDVNRSIGVTVVGEEKTSTLGW